VKKSDLKKLAKGIALPTFDLSFRFLVLPSRFICKGRILFDAEEFKGVHKAFLSQNLFSIEGKMVPTFEREFAQAYGVPYAVTSTSGTAAVHVTLGAIDLDPGDEVITAPITDLGTIVPILYQNAIPVFADIDETYNMDSAYWRWIVGYRFPPRQYGTG
jgi:dTDP-4-amino-4,6-dideoxygalactose transaminase